MEKEKFQTLLTLMANRRSIRQYTAEPINDNLLSVLLEKAARTQTMGNLQLYSVVVTRNEEMKQRLAPFHFNQPMVTAAPVVLTFCADYHRTSAWCRERHATPGYDNFLSFINAATDALLFCQTFCTDRLPLTAFMHDEVYQPVTPATIDRDYTAKEELPENKEFVRINGTETLAQIFTDIRYTKKDCETMSQGLLNVLRRQKFLNDR